MMGLALVTGIIPFLLISVTMATIYLSSTETASETSPSLASKIQRTSVRLVPSPGTEKSTGLILFAGITASLFFLALASNAVSSLHDQLDASSVARPLAGLPAAIEPTHLELVPGQLGWNARRWGRDRGRRRARY